MDDLVDLVRASPDEDSYSAAIECLRALEAQKGELPEGAPRLSRDEYESLWSRLHKAVEGIAIDVARELGLEVDEVRAELHMSMYGSWVKEWVLVGSGLSPGKKKSALLFFHDRLRGRFRASKRTAIRRSKAMAEAASEVETGRVEVGEGQHLSTALTSIPENPDDEIRQCRRLAILQSCRSERKPSLRSPRSDSPREKLQP